MMFTHFGVTGPMVLSASSASWADIWTREENCKAVLDLKPALSE